MQSEKTEIVTGVLLPIEGDTKEIQIPAGLNREEFNKEILKILNESINAGIVDNNICSGGEVFFYYRDEVGSDFKKHPCPCMVGKKTNGNQLMSNEYVRQWRRDPWKKHYGPVILLKVQFGKYEFTYSSYVTDAYIDQCRLNRKKFGELPKLKSSKPVLNPNLDVETVYQSNENDALKEIACLKEIIASERKQHTSEKLDLVIKIKELEEQVERLKQ